jgi:NAD(P)-dependent dehydrogenase (short-subunit alcohol dehydrogenase family)
MEELDIKGAVAVVTGATRGVGRATVDVLGRSGARIVVVGRTTDAQPNAVLPGTCESVVRDLEAEGVEARAVKADLSDPDQVDEIVVRTLDWFGRCDILVNNAAYTSNGPMMEVPARRWARAFQVQVVSPLQLIQGFVPGMVERGAGRVVNVSSGASQSFTPGLALYSVSKQAMERFGDYLQLELGGRGVSFNTLRIDQIVTTEGWHYVKDTQGEDVATGGQGAHDLLTPAQCAEALAWMVRQPASWSGHTVGFDDIRALGGMPPR